MNLNGQLALSQTSSDAAFVWLSGQEFRNNAGLLGNTDIQSLHSSRSTSSLAARIVRAEAEVVRPKESANMDWLVRNAEELGQYKGEWLLISEQRLAVHDRNFAAIRDTIARNQIVSPLVYYVPTDEESNSVTI